MVMRTVGWLVLRRLVGLTGLGRSPDAKDVEIAVCSSISSWFCVGR